MTEPLPPSPVGALRAVPLLSDLGDQELLRLAESSKQISVPAGTTLFEEGSAGDQFYVILQGEMEVTRRAGGQTIVLAVLGPGGFLSEMSLLEDRPRSASARAIQDSTLIGIEPGDFEQLLASSPGAAVTMLNTVTARLRSTESSLVERGRLVGLGTLAAGLAHELNNPATAILRSSNLLGKALAGWGKRCSELGQSSPGAAEVDLMTSVEASSFRNRDTQAEESRPDLREFELEEWLEERGLEGAWAVAPPLADAGWDRQSLESLMMGVDPARGELLVRWLAAGAEAFGLVDEIHRGAKAISAIVGNVRSYSHLDRGPVQKVDVAESISDTLAILKGKLGVGIRVVQDLEEDLPAIEAHGGELNQVWTNLIDNALDAMGGVGTLEIRGRSSEEGIVMEVEDDGPGIPPEIRPCIFDPFYTTKPQGSGTGLGLAITYGIVVNRHRGTIEVDSRPGRTVFTVALPARLEREK
jgi:signal transduction histidine kinase